MKPDQWRTVTKEHKKGKTTHLHKEQKSKGDSFSQQDKRKGKAKSSSLVTKDLCAYILTVGPLEIDSAKQWFY